MHAWYSVDQPRNVLLLIDRSVLSQTAHMLRFKIQLLVVAVCFASFVPVKAKQGTVLGEPLASEDL